MTTAEFIRGIESYFGEYERPGVKAVVAKVVDELDPEIRAALCQELMRTLSTGWKRCPDWADIDKALYSPDIAKARSRLRELRELEKPRLPASPITDAERAEAEAAGIGGNWMAAVLANRRRVQ